MEWTKILEKHNLPNVSPKERENHITPISMK